VQEIRLRPLVRDDLMQVIVDAASLRVGAAAPLAQLVHDKTGGQSVFRPSVSFLRSAEEGLLRFRS